MDTNQNHRVRMPGSSDSIDELLALFPVTHHYSSCVRREGSSRDQPVEQRLVGAHVSVQRERTKHRIEVRRPDETTISVQRRFVSNSSRFPLGSLRASVEVSTVHDEKANISSAIPSLSIQAPTATER